MRWGTRSGNVLTRSWTVTVYVFLVCTLEDRDGDEIDDLEMELIGCAKNMRESMFSSNTRQRNSQYSRRGGKVE